MPHRDLLPGERPGAYEFHLQIYENLSGNDRVRRPGYPIGPNFEDDSIRFWSGMTRADREAAIETLAARFEELARNPDRMQILTAAEDRRALDQLMATLAERPGETVIPKRMPRRVAPPSSVTVIEKTTPGFTPPP
jgi:hypothetical protein